MTEPGTLLVNAPAAYPAERRYVLDVVLAEWLGLAYELAPGTDPRTSIQLAGDPAGLVLSLPDILFATPASSWLTEASIPSGPRPRLDAAPLLAGSRDGGPAAPAGQGLSGIPALFADRTTSGPVWRDTAGGGELGIDIFGSVFFELSRYEEIARPVKDDRERFPGAASLAASEGLVERPLVDEHVDILWAAIRRLWPGLERRPPTFRLRLTHDVDWPWAAGGLPASGVLRAAASDLVRRREPAVAGRRLRSLLDARRGRVDRDPLNTFDLLMDASERHGIRSTFYFMAGPTGLALDGRYHLSDPPVADLLRRIHARGHDVGLHASYGSFRSPELVRREFEALRAGCRAAGFDQASWGVRQHFLRFEAPGTWRHHEAAGLEHDSTLGFADLVGFRAGTCREFPLFDVVEGRRLQLRERPLVAMDATLFAHLRLGLDDAAHRVRSIVDTCRRHGGDAVVLYHNSSLPGPRERAHYRDLVQELTRQA